MSPAAEHTIFANRCAAGRQLARRLASYRHHDPIVLALPRGGVPVAYEVAHALEAPLGILVVRKIVAPARPSLVIGAVTHGASYIDEETVALAGIARDYVDASLAREGRIAERLLRSLQEDGPEPELKDCTAIVVDDGIVTGATALVAIEVVRQRRPARIVLAAPVCAPDAYEKLRTRADDVVYITRPDDFRVLAGWYADFTPVRDAEVRRLLKLARLEREARFATVST